MELCSAAKDIGIGGAAFLQSSESQAGSEKKHQLPPHAVKKGATDFVVMAVTTGTILGFSHDGVGFLLGCFAAAVFKVRELWEVGERVEVGRVFKRVRHEFASLD